MPAFIDLTGQKYGRLLALKRDFSQDRNEANWLCRCDCGKICIVLRRQLRSGKTKSCGCWQREWTIQKHTKHGHAAKRSPEYRIWSHMLGRCYNPTDNAFHNYGARGIRVCKEWRRSFAQFLTDMGPRPHPTSTIERINNHRGYSAQNCRWATHDEQGRNKRNNHSFTHDGVTGCVADWARIFRIDYSLMHYHLVKKRRTIEDAMALIRKIARQC